MRSRNGNGKIRRVVGQKDEDSLKNIIPRKSRKNSREPPKTSEKKPSAKKNWQNSTLRLVGVKS